MHKNFILSMQEQKISTIEGLIDEVTKDIGNYSITQVQNTQEYKFGLACYKVFGKELGQITKNDVDTVWADGRADGGIDLMYITEEDGKNILNICQAKYGQNVDNNTITEAFHKMIKTFDNLKKKKNYNEYSERLKKIALNKIDEDYSSIKFVVFLNKDFETNHTINSVKRKFQDEKTNIEIYTKKDILEEMDQHQEQPNFVKEDKIDKEGSTLEMGFSERARDGIVINARASSLWRLYNKYHNNGLFEQNLRYFTKKTSVDNPIIKSIHRGGKDFWFHNNGIIIACTDFKNDGSNVKLWDFSIINGCQTVSLIGQYWAEEGSDEKDKDFTVLCKIIKPKEGENYDNFVREIAHSANNQKPIQGRDLKSNDPVQDTLQGLFATHLQYFYEIKRGERHKKHQLPKKITNTDLGLITLAFFCQKPGTARSGKSKIFSQETLYKDTFNKVAKFLPQKPKAFSGFLLLWSKINDAMQKIDKIEGDSDGHAKDFLNNGKYFVFAIMGYMFVKAFGKDNKEIDLWDIESIFDDTISDNLSALLDDIVRRMALCVGKEYKSQQGKVKSMANFVKSDAHYPTIKSAIDERFFCSSIELQETRERLQKIFNVEFNNQTPSTD